jgi:hypothetical protein
MKNGLFGSGVIDGATDGEAGAVEGESGMGFSFG